MRPRPANVPLKIFLIVAMLLALVAPQHLAAQATQPTTRPTFSLSLTYGGKLLVDRSATHDPAARLQLVADPAWDAADVYVDWQRLGVLRTTAGSIDLGTLTPGVHQLQVANATIGRKGDLVYAFNIEIQKAAAATAGHLWGTIADNGEVGFNAAWMREAGFNCVREWVSFNAATGQLTNADKIDRCNAYAASGLTVIVTLTPTVNAQFVVPCDPAVNALIARLDKRCIIQLGNEPNLATYWPWADWRAAFKYFNPYSIRFRAAGFRTASPSLTTGDAPQQFIDCWKIIVADGNDDFDYVDAHAYTNDAVKFDKAIAAYQGVAYGINCKLMISEWAHTSQDEAKLIADLPAMAATLKNRASASAFFIGARIEKHKDWPSLVDPASGTRTPLFGAFKKLPLQPTKVISAAADKTKYFAVVTYPGAIDGYCDGGWPRGAPRRYLDGMTLDKATRDWGLDRIPRGTPYLFNAIEGKFDEASLAIITDCLAAAKARGLSPAFYGYPLDPRWVGGDVPSNDVLRARFGSSIDQLVAQFYFGNAPRITAADEAGFNAYLDEMLRLCNGDAGRAAIILSPHSVDGSTEIPLAINRRVIELAAARGIHTVWIWSDNGASAHAAATVQMARGIYSVSSRLSIRPAIAEKVAA